MVFVRKPPDTSGEISGLATSIGNAATAVGGFRNELGSTGDRLYKGWYGAAERMVAREIQTLAGFLDDLYKGLSEAATELNAYATALRTAESDLKKEEARKFVVGERMVPDPYGGGLGLFVSPNLTNSFNGPWGNLTVENARILSVLKPAATKAYNAVMAAGPLIAKGSGGDLKSIIDYRLPFQRPYPLIPGVPHAGDKIPKWTGDITQVQELLVARGWRRITVTGKNDETTQDIVRQFQEEKGIKPADGKVDQKTWEALWNRKITGW